MANVSYDRPKLARLIDARDKAVQAGELEFTLDGDVYLVAYAKFLIEYLEERLPK